MGLESNPETSCTQNVPETISNIGYNNVSIYCDSIWSIIRKMINTNRKISGTKDFGKLAVRSSCSIFKLC